MLEILKNKLKRLIGKKDELKSMNKKEKKEFLSNDLIERMIRVEQKVSYSFGKDLPYNKTEYYKSLTETEKKNFEEYLDKKQRRKYLLGLILLVPIIVIVLSNVQFTGRVIEESVSDLSFSYFSWIILGIFGAGVFLFLFKRMRKKRLDSYGNVIDNILMRKYRVNL